MQSFGDHVLIRFGGRVRWIEFSEATGRPYIKQFIDYGLPSLIAPGNLPALTAVLPCRLVFLTSAKDAEIDTSPAPRVLGGEVR